MLQRDAFIEQITKELEKDKSIYFLSADFGAAALDSLRERFKSNFLHYLMLCNLYQFYIYSLGIRHSYYTEN